MSDIEKQWQECVDKFGEAQQITAPDGYRFTGEISTTVMEHCINVQYNIEPVVDLRIGDRVRVVAKTSGCLEGFRAGDECEIVDIDPGKSRNYKIKKAHGVFEVFGVFGWANSLDIELIEKDDPHAELKALYAKDVEICESIDGIEAWGLWQHDCGRVGHWQTLPTNPTWCQSRKYRRHPQADLMIQYHKCSDDDKKRWQMKMPENKSWRNIYCEQEWNDDFEYRMKPETIIINDKEFNAPMRVVPEIGSMVSHLSLYGISKAEWTGDKLDYDTLKNGMCFYSEEDAQAVFDALNAILKGEL